jgi:hypothetical protein
MPLARISKAELSAHSNARRQIMNKRRFSSIAGFFAAIAVAFVAGAWAQSQARVVWRWPDSMEAVHAAPKNNKVLFENDHIRLLEVRVQPGETENMHGHIWPSVFAYDAVQPKGTNHVIDSDTQSHGREFENADWYAPQCRTMGPQALHQITDTDVFPQHFYRIEFKQMDGKSVESKTSY